MRYPASEKLEIIRLVEKSHLPVRRTLDKLGKAMMEEIDTKAMNPISKGDASNV